MKVSRSEHAKALKILSEHPEFIGISKSKVITASIEQKLFFRGRPFTKIDLVYELKNDGAIIVEYKSNGDKRLLIKGKSQLERAVDFYQKIKKIPAEGRLITGDAYPILRNYKFYNKSKKNKKYTNRPFIKKITS